MRVFNGEANLETARSEVPPCRPTQVPSASRNGGALAIGRSEAIRATTSDGMMTVPGAAGPFDAPEQNGSSSVSLPQFNLSPSGRHDSDASKDVDMEAEELDTMGEMPPVAGIGRAGTRMGAIMGPSPTRKSRRSFTTRAAGSLQRSFTAMSDSGVHGEFNTEVGEMHCDPCHCIYSWQALVTLQGMLGCLWQSRCLLHYSCRAYNASRVYMAPLPGMKPQTVVQGLLSQGVWRPSLVAHALCAEAVQHSLAVCKTHAGCCAHLPDWEHRHRWHQRDLGRCHVSRVCSLY